MPRYGADLLLVRQLEQFSHLQCESVPHKERRGQRNYEKNTVSDVVFSFLF